MASVCHGLPLIASLIDVSAPSSAVSPFDPKSVEMFRVIAEKATEKGGRKTHFYPLSMLTYADEHRLDLMNTNWL